MNRTGATLPHPNASAGIDRVGERAPRERRRERRFEFGRELEADGRWVRQESAFRRWVTADGSSGLPAVAGRYHLYVSLCDPWSHRSVIVRLKLVDTLLKSPGGDYEIVLKNGQRLRVSRSRREALEKALGMA